MVIENYEKIRWPVTKADPVEVIKFTMEQRGLKVKTSLHASVPVPALTKC
jgi:antitoxin component HigA of HigAB toxin-antitoxin module